MRHMILYSGLLLCLLCVPPPPGREPAAHAIAHQSMDLARYVDPLIGTAPGGASHPVANGAGGNVFPGAAFPFGMVQWSPDTGNTPGGYLYSESSIQDFSLTHFDGAGCSNNQDIAIAPTIGAGNSAMAVDFSHQNERATAGSYIVTRNDQVKTELTVTQRTGFARFTFPPTTYANIVLDATRSANGSEHPGVQILPQRREVSGQETSGHFCWAHNQYTLYFDAQFDHDFTTSKTWTGGTLLTFNTTDQPVVQMKIGLSYVSVANARGNLLAENNTWSFDSVKNNARSIWNSLLNHIQVSGGSTNELIKFYTALYHSLLHPNVFSDSNGQYIGFDKQVHTALAYTQYANFSGWDIYRSQIPFLALFFQPQANDIMRSLLQDALECGAFPRWAQNNDEAGVMVGDPGSISVVQGYTFGATGFDAASALAIMVRTATQPNVRCSGFTIRPSLASYLAHGYIPRETFTDWGPAATTLEYSNADFAISRLALALSKRTLAGVLAAHAAFWHNEFNCTSRYIEPRYGNGWWEIGFNPGSENGFVEGNAAQYSWMIPYDLAGLFTEMGGNNAVIARLDTFFSRLNAGLSDPYFYIGNEPNFATPWIYNWAQAPSRTQRVVRDLLDEAFTSRPDGLPGNDDLGAMSSWYLFGALGLYPEIPGVAGFALASPLFATATLTLGNGHIVTINAPDAPAVYVQHMRLNGQAYQSSWLPLSAISSGATIDYRLGMSPSAWGSDPTAAPPSYGSGVSSCPH